MSVSGAECDIVVVVGHVTGPVAPCRRATRTAGRREVEVVVGRWLHVVVGIVARPACAGTLGCQTAMHGYMYCGRSLCAPPGLVVTLASDWVEKRGPRVRLPARGVFAVVLHCMEGWSWELQRPHLKAGNFAVIVGGAVASSPLPMTGSATGAPALASMSVPSLPSVALNPGCWLP